MQLLIPDCPSPDELRPYLERMHAARWYSNFGPLVLELEAKLQGYFRPDAQSVLYLTTISNCTIGLELALWALGLRRGSRVLIPALTFVATAGAVLRAGHEPVLCDIDSESWLLTPEIARRALSEGSIHAVMPVSTYGCPQDPAAWDAFSRTTGVPVVVDAAGSFGTQRAGATTTLVFSLHATKALSAGEGGFVISSDPALVSRVRRMSNFGIDFISGLVDSPGTNGKMSEYHAAAALAMLERWGEHAARRIELHALYISALKKDCPHIILQRRPDDGVYSIMPVLLPHGYDSKAVATALHAQGIETRRWYCPAIHHQPGFHTLQTSGSLETVESLNERLLALPFHPFLRPDDIQFVCSRLKDIVR